VPWIAEGDKARILDKKVGTFYQISGKDNVRNYPKYHRYPKYPNMSVFLWD
jgi:hypothetical protein